MWQYHVMPCNIVAFSLDETETPGPQFRTAQEGAGDWHSGQVGAKLARCSHTELSHDVGAKLLTSSIELKTHEAS